MLARQWMIQRALLRAEEAADGAPRARYELVRNLAETTLKSLSVTAAAACAAEGVVDERVGRSLSLLVRPSFGHWNGTLRTVLRPGKAPREVEGSARLERVRISWQRLGALGVYYVVVALERPLLGP